MSDPSSTESAFSIFQQPWWLEAAAPGSWEEVELREDGKLVARLPFVRRVRYGLTILTMPVLTQSLGPWLADSGSDSTRARLSRDKRLITSLIERLPDFDFFGQALHPSCPNWQPFYWRGFRQTTYYTHIIEDLTDLDAVYRGLESGMRRDIKRASTVLKIGWDMPATAFYDHLIGTLSRSGKHPNYTRETFVRIHDACVSRDQGRILYAEDSNGAIHAALFMVWDSACAYYLVTSTDPAWRAEGSGALLAWEAIRASASITQQFNLEGSMIEGVERYNRGFGGTHVPYLFVFAASRRGRVVRAGRDLVRATLGRPDRAWPP
jgi:hypothetical protein